MPIRGFFSLTFRLRKKQVITKSVIRAFFTDKTYLQGRYYAQNDRREKLTRTGLSNHSHDPSKAEIGPAYAILNLTLRSYLSGKIP